PTARRRLSLNAAQRSNKPSRAVLFAHRRGGREPGVRVKHRPIEEIRKARMAARLRSEIATMWLWIAKRLEMGHWRRVPNTVRALFRRHQAREFPDPEFRESPRWMHAGSSALVIIAQKCWKLRKMWPQWNSAVGSYAGTRSPLRNLSWPRCFSLNVPKNK